MIPVSLYEILDNCGLFCRLCPIGNIREALGYGTHL
nr:MAG TPA: 4Fe-4S binding domain protein [Bacteriophage sp.]